MIAGDARNFVLAGATASQQLFALGDLKKGAKLLCRRALVQGEVLRLVAGEQLDGFGLACEASDFSIPLPNFYIVTVNQRLCRRDCRSVVGCFEEYSRVEMTVVVDEKQKMWHDYLCDLWPSQFVVDRDGIVRYSHGGIGRYEDMDKIVQGLLN